MARRLDASCLRLQIGPAQRRITSGDSARKFQINQDIDSKDNDYGIKRVAPTTSKTSLLIWA